MSHELKFKVGDTVRVIADKFADDPYGPDSHNTPIGCSIKIIQVSKATRKGPLPRDYQEYQSTTGYWFAEDELKAVEESEHA